MGAIREQLANWKMSRGFLECALETERSREVVQAEAVAWAQPGTRETSRV